MKPSQDSSYLSIGEYVTHKYEHLGIDIQTAIQIKQIAVNICKRDNIKPHYTQGSGHMRSRLKTLKVQKKIWEEAFDEYSKERS